MNIVCKFNDILLKKTRNGFHDSSLLEFKIRLEEKQIYIEIEHWKDGENGEEKIFTGKFLFKEFSNIHLDNKVNCFGIDNEISSFEINEKDNVFTLTGIKGWVLSFSSTSFDYQEELKEIYKY